MVNSALAIGMCGSVFAAVVALPFMRKPKDKEELECSIDERLHDRMCEYACRSDWAFISDEEATRFLEAQGGIVHLLAQARVLMGLTVLMHHESDKYADELEEIEARGRAIEIVLGSWLHRVFMRRVPAKTLIEAFTDMCAAWYSITLDS